MAHPAGDGENTDLRQPDLQAVTPVTDGADLAEMHDMLALMLAGRPAWAPDPRPPPRRRGESVTYRVRVDLDDASPPCWRRLELSSALYLDEVHLVLQAAFGWTDSHLHHFASGHSRNDPDAEYYLPEALFEDGEDGCPEQQVRLDELLTGAGDKLFYEYDFGDDWRHTVKLEAVLPRRTSGPLAVCTAGRRDGPPEDCGGVGGFDLISACTDPATPDLTRALKEFEQFFGYEFDKDDWDESAPFDLGEINEELAELEIGDEAAAGEDDPDEDEEAEPDPGCPEPLADLLQDARTPAAHEELQRLIGKAHLDQPVLISAETAARMVRPYAWLLDQAGDKGIKLTQAGYLPPRLVTAALRELDLWQDWMGNVSRESQAPPVGQLRESATRMGLVRKLHGTLLITARGRQLRADPVKLWWHLAGSMPVRSAEPGAAPASLLLLLMLAAGPDAAGSDRWRDAVMTRLMGAMGWATARGGELHPFAARLAALDTEGTLDLLGALTVSAEPQTGSTVTPDGVSFARAALATWLKA